VADVALGRPQLLPRAAVPVKAVCDGSCRGADGFPNFASAVRLRRFTIGDAVRGVQNAAAAACLRASPRASS
jgi:hypothetical protein